MCVCVCMYMLSQVHVFFWIVPLDATRSPCPSFWRGTQFAPDWCFSLTKQKLRKSIVGCLADLANAIEQSAKSNIAQLAGTEDGTPIVTTFDWIGYLAPHFRRVPHFKRQHHFTTSTDSPRQCQFKGAQWQWGSGVLNCSRMTGHLLLPIFLLSLILLGYQQSDSGTCMTTLESTAHPTARMLFAHYLRFQSLDQYHLLQPGIHQQKQPHSLHLHKHLLQL